MPDVELADFGNCGDAADVAIREAVSHVQLQAVFDGKTGQQYFTLPRASGTLIEYPVVADIDNDQSADILVVSNTNFQGYMHTIEAFQDTQKRWKPTRRIWNQHAYHVTNVREDGTIPKQMQKSWQKLNTFRTNSQIQPGGDCAPPPPNPPK